MHRPPRLNCSIVAIGIATLLCLPEPSAAASDDTNNWPRFRGPEFMPVADHPNLPERWSTTENVEWVSEVPGVGWSSPIVWDGKIFLTAATSEQAMKQPSLGLISATNTSLSCGPRGFPLKKRTRDSTPATVRCRTRSSSV